MNPLKKLFKQTAIYGLATVLPRMISFLLVPIYTDVMAPGKYGEVTLIFSWFAIFNVFLAYGMETAFFRFYKESENRKKVVSTSLLSIMGSTALLVLVGILFKTPLSTALNIDLPFMNYVLGILALDALAIIPFAWLRANEKPMRYAIVKILNVSLNLGLTLFFLIFLPKIATGSSTGFFNSLYKPDYEIPYILIANLIASGVTLLLMIRVYIRKPYVFDKDLWKRMVRYAMPVMVAGIAFTINEVFDRYLLSELLPIDIAKSEMGKYSACYKLALFMTLFATAFRMGIEPFFFSHSDTKNPQKAYAQITNYFVVLGSIILLSVVVFSDVLKRFLVLNESYWDAMPIVPLIVLASFFLGIYHNLSVWYKVTDRTKFGAYISMIGAVLTIIINLIFIPYFGYMASAVATLMAYGTMMMLSFYFGRMYYPIPYNFRKIIFYLGMSILFSTLSFYIFDRNLFIGIPLLLVFLGLVYKLEFENLKKLYLNR
ncbi:polysaccharide biosynthesis protein [Maribacter sp. 6B07]|uniref:lipopolysaccharide biosynthesis protein n=1 Tax=Maribacter TaxID=252356 RepID=UPI000B84ED39|nr:MULTISPECIES: oligosaccharide flippase family protein [Maribacter]PHN94897.1 polysaccharide biosynthesis protein [Maribacter sp. 6B07]HAF78515.1 polysaccharide biosynthesis protein [Maribacter sp.]HAI41864.1 polysaccharide biosynthesis protein [Maribacter sp.]